MRLFSKLLFVFIFISVKITAQEKWNLKSCVEFAINNNIAVRQSQIQSQLSALTFKQSKLSLYPNFSFGGSTAYNSGNNQDPTTFSRVTENYLSAGMQLQSSADIFNFFSKRNLIAANQWSLMAAIAEVNKIKSDIALSTANAYLQILLANEQEKIVTVQVNQSQVQLNNTLKLVEAGSLPELNATQLEAQLAVDSGTLISAKGNVAQAVLSLKLLMSIDADKEFDYETPPVESIPIESIADLQPDFVYAQAIKNLPQQIGNVYKLKAAQKNKQSARGSLYPSLGAFGNLSSNYLSFTKRPVYSKTFSNYESTGLVADAGSGILYDVQSPVFNNGDIIGYIKPGSFGAQMNDNFRKSIGLSFSVPLFNSASAKTYYEKSKLNIRSIELQKEQDNQKLKQDIYQAYNAAMVALQKFNASTKSVEANQKSYDFATKRFNIGALSMYDLISSQNNLLRAKLEFSINQFDYVFKMKVLEFYKGAGLKL